MTKILHVREGEKIEDDKDAIKALVDANRRITTREIELRLNLSNSTVYDHLKGLGLSSKLDVWVPLVLREGNLRRRIDVCDSLPKRHENYPFLKRIIIGDEKCHGAKKMNRLKPFPKPIFTKKSSRLKTEEENKQSNQNLSCCVDHWTAMAGPDIVQSGRPIFIDFFQHLWPYIGNNTANVVFQMVKRLWLIRIDQ
ncbi:mariner transposase [Trichonephila clavipes]|uniref:Mariner transposase n=1 Tax=Trichonephila clavipes TaxID=2585209 RepID=A0A8X6S3E9_TRICX|nr:mariner transposase [Trichonephila clavipes]